MLFYAQSVAKGHVRAKQRYSYHKYRYSDSLFNKHSTTEDWRKFGKIKLNQPGMQKVGRSKTGKQAQEANYTLTYYWLRKREPLIALD